MARDRRVKGAWNRNSGSHRKYFWLGIGPNTYINKVGVFHIAVLSTVFLYACCQIVNAGESFPHQLLYPRNVFCMYFCNIHYGIFGAVLAATPHPLLPERGLCIISLKLVSLQPRCFRIDNQIVRGLWISMINESFKEIHIVEIRSDCFDTID